MSYTYGGKRSPDHQAEQRRQKLMLGILAYREATASISAKLSALRNQRDREIAEALRALEMILLFPQLGNVTAARR